MRKHIFLSLFFSPLRLVSNRKVKVNEQQRESDRERYPDARLCSVYARASARVRACARTRMRASASILTARKNTRFVKSATRVANISVKIRKLAICARRRKRGRLNSLRSRGLYTVDTFLENALLGNKYLVTCACKSGRLERPAVAGIKRIAPRERTMVPARNRSLCPQTGKNNHVKDREDGRKDGQ